MNEKIVKYTYVDNSEYPIVKIVYECTAIDILEADEKFEQEIGYSPRKKKYIAVKIN